MSLIVLNNLHSSYTAPRFSGLGFVFKQARDEGDLAKVDLTLSGLRLRQRSSSNSAIRNTQLGWGAVRKNLKSDGYKLAWFRTLLQLF